MNISDILEDKIDEIQAKVNCLPDESIRTHISISINELRSLLDEPSELKVHKDSKRCFNCLHWMEQWNSCEIQRGSGNKNYKCSKWK